MSTVDIDRNEKTTQQRLDMILYELEQMVYKDMGYQYIDGGYAKATSTKSSDIGGGKYRYITLEYGVDNPSTSYKCVEKYKYHIKQNRVTEYCPNKKWRSYGRTTK